MLLHGINDHILISHPSYSGVYQDKAIKWELHKVINHFWGRNKKKKNWQNVGARLSIRIGDIFILIYSLQNLMGAGWCGIFFIYNIDGEMCTTKWVLFSYALWRLLVPLCTVSSGTIQMRWKNSMEVATYRECGSNIKYSYIAPIMVVILKLITMSYYWCQKMLQIALHSPSSPPQYQGHWGKSLTMTLQQEIKLPSNY